MPSRLARTGIQTLLTASALVLAACTSGATSLEPDAPSGIVSELPAGELEVPYDEEEPEAPSEDPEGPVDAPDASSGPRGAPDDWRPDVVGNADTSPCPISWRPNALAPVFYGYRDYGAAHGAPAAVRVYFPSLEGSPASAAMLQNCGRYPVVMFAHGQCQSDTDHHQRWQQVPAQLARSGYVVVVPALPLANAPHPTHPALTIMDGTLAWLQQTWELRSQLLPSVLPGVAGHSYGGLLAAEFARTRPVSGLVAVGADWHSWSGSWPVFGVSKPKLVIWGGAENYAQLDQAQWDALSSPKHRAVFTSGAHWDYLPAGISSCHPTAGACTLIPSATADLVTMFFARYLPPEFSADLPSRVPLNLYPPTLTLTPEQQFFAGGHLQGLRAMGSGSCGYTLSIPAPPPSSLRTVPYVRELDSATAGNEVRNAGLKPVFHGSGSWVYSQSPRAGAQVTVNSIVNLTLRSGPLP